MIVRRTSPKKYDKHAVGGIDKLENQSRELRQASIKHRTVDDKYLEPKKAVDELETNGTLPRSENCCRRHWCCDGG